MHASERNTRLRRYRAGPVVDPDAHAKLCSNFMLAKENLDLYSLKKLPGKFSQQEFRIVVWEAQFYEIALFDESTSSCTLFRSIFFATFYFTLFL